MPQRRARQLIPIEQARANREPIDWLHSGPDGGPCRPPKPKFIGRREFRNFDLGELAGYIDWGPFFQTWDLHGAFPGILNDETVGESARRVFPTARRC
jgi:5-methyltetrahydrofolate--homocysteine methyltransferase